MTIEQIEKELTALKNSGEIKGYIFAIIGKDDIVQLASNATSIESFGLAQFIINNRAMQEAVDNSAKWH